MAAHLSTCADQDAVLDEPGAAEVESASASAAVAAQARTISRDGCHAAAELIDRVDLARGRIGIALGRDALAETTGLPAERLAPTLLRTETPFTCRRRGAETRIIAGDREPAPDTTLIRALRNAHRWSDALKAGTPLGKLAAPEKVAERYLARITHLAGLSPRIQVAILEGSQPPELTLERLVKVQLPLDWREQERLFGVAH